MDLWTMDGLQAPGLLEFCQAIRQLFGCVAQFAAFLGVQALVAFDQLEVLRRGDVIVYAFSTLTAHFL